MIAAPPASGSPYPGLRPYRQDETDLFFGREEQIRELLARLEGREGDGREDPRAEAVRPAAAGRFLIVIGESGCGKSSLVRAGILGHLETAFRAGVGPRWLLADMKPGDQPLRNLAQALISESALGLQRAGEADVASTVYAMLCRGPLGVVEFLAETPVPGGARLMILVDQFEEIFRFREERLREGKSADEADAFVALLVETARHPEIPAYVVLTMRSDFLGDCALFPNLPEAINDGQFLAPRLTREQTAGAIRGPARLFGAEVEAALVNRLLNDLGPDPARLPVLQHALQRLWTLAVDRQPKGAGERAAPDGGPLLTVDLYEEIGGLDAALSRHADEAFGELSPDGKRIAEILFRRLTERDSGRRDTRRRAYLEDVAAVAGVDPEQMYPVVEAFRRPDRSFLMPPADTPLGPQTLLDISHESLIREWDLLQKWVAKETTAAEGYERFAYLAHRWDRDGKREEKNLLSTSDLEEALAWKQEHAPNAAWASRYGSKGDYPVLEELIARSAQARQEEQKRQKEEAARSRRLRLTGILVPSSIVLALVLWGVVGLAVERKTAALAAQTKKAKSELATADDKLKRLRNDLEITNKTIENQQQALMNQKRALELQREAAAKELETQKKEAAAERARLKAQYARDSKVLRIKLKELQDATGGEAAKLQMLRDQKTALETQMKRIDTQVRELRRQRETAMTAAQLAQSKGAPGGEGSAGAPLVWTRDDLWKPGSVIRVRFLDGDPSLHQKVERIARQWTEGTSLKLEFVPGGKADIRITFKQPGAWSFLGTAALRVPEFSETMNLGSLTTAKSEAAFTRDVLREFGHMLGLINEHQNPNAEIPWNQEAVYRFYGGSPYYWPREVVDLNLLRKYKAAGSYREFDPQSVMAYPIPKELTDGKFEIKETYELSTGDRAFIRQLYPPR